MQKEWEEAHSVTEELVESPPSRRANATLTACPNGNHLWCIGGEFFSEDGKAVRPLFAVRRIIGWFPTHAVLLSRRVPIHAGKGTLSYRVSLYSTWIGRWPFDLRQDEWRKFVSKTCPGPRSAHAVVASAASGGKLFLFGWSTSSAMLLATVPMIKLQPGGEFSSLHQNTFHHYRDFWCFDIATHSWDRIDTKVRPSARSGHRYITIHSR